jgi:hypothetical protein
VELGPRVDPVPKTDLAQIHADLYMVRAINNFSIWDSVHTKTADEDIEKEISRRYKLSKAKPELIKYT